MTEKLRQSIRRTVKKWIVLKLIVLVVLGCFTGCYSQVKEDIDKEYAEVNGEDSLESIDDVIGDDEVELNADATEVDSMEPTESVADTPQKKQLFEELVGEYQYIKEDAPEGRLIIEDSEYTPGSLEISDYTQGQSYRFLASGVDVEKVVGDSVYIRYPEIITGDGDATFTYYIVKKTADGVDVSFSRESYDKAEIIYHAIKQ